jgi:hypothetical protein
MSVTSRRQFCAICAWRENCAKKFCVADCGAHCPDFTRDVAFKGDSGPDDKAGSADREGR